jgi:hypothetical protein
VAEPLHERAVDLEHVDREAVQVAERRVIADAGVGGLSVAFTTVLLTAMVLILARTGAGRAFPGPARLPWLTPSTDSAWVLVFRWGVDGFRHGLEHLFDQRVGGAGGAGTMVDGLAAQDLDGLPDAARAERVLRLRGLVVRDGGCTFPGCDRPPAWCEAHHLRHWLHGGPPTSRTWPLCAGLIIGRCTRAAGA